MAHPNEIMEGVAEASAKTKEVLATGGGKYIVEATAPVHAAPGLAGAVSGLASPLILGGFAAISAVVNQMEYTHERDRIARFYSDEIATKLHKSGGKAKEADLDVFEKGNEQFGVAPNNVIKQAVSKERWKRNVGIAASFVASIAAFTLIGSIVPEVTGLALVAKAAVSVLTYMAIKAPILKVADSLIGLTKETAHDKIVAISKNRAKGKSVTKEQLVDVFISGNKDLANYVEGRYGLPYEELPLLDKAQITRDLAEYLPIEAIQKNINSGVTQASELAFTVQGDVSGVLPKAPEVPRSPSRLQIAGEKISRWLKKDDQPIKDDMQDLGRIAQEFMEAPKAPSQTDVPASNFTERVSGKSANPSMGHVERLAQQRAAQILAPSTNTIH